MTIVYRHFDRTATDQLCSAWAEPPLQHLFTPGVKTVCQIPGTKLFAYEDRNKAVRAACIEVWECEAEEVEVFPLAYIADLWACRSDAEMLEDVQRAWRSEMPFFPWESNTEFSGWVACSAITPLRKLWSPAEGWVDE